MRRAPRPPAGVPEAYPVIEAPGCSNRRHPSAQPEIGDAETTPRATRRGCAWRIRSTRRRGRDEEATVTRVARFVGPGRPTCPLRRPDPRWLARACFRPNRSGASTARSSAAPRRSGASPARSPPPAKAIGPSRDDCAVSLPALAAARSARPVPAPVVSCRPRLHLTRCDRRWLCGTVISGARNRIRAHTRYHYAPASTSGVPHGPRDPRSHRSRRAGSRRRAAADAIDRACGGAMTSTTAGLTSLAGSVASRCLATRMRRLRDSAARRCATAATRPSAFRRAAPVPASREH
ncbi:hypothetical protein J2S22_001431 [Rhodoplanes tepidamans]|nr:hypothetical protein [Rhodoplanes tepidamans]